MLSEKRVKHMIRMAMFKKYESHEYASLLNTTKKDYVSFRQLLATIAGTVIYLVIVGGAAAALYTIFLNEISRVVVILAIMAALLGYIVFLYICRRFVHERAVNRYTRAKRKINRMKRDWEILEQLYEEEASRTTPQGFAKESAGDVV